MARARRLAAAGALTAFVVGGLSIGIGTASAQAADDSCLLPLLPCDTQDNRGLPLPDLKLPNPLDSTPGGTPAPQDSWSQGPEGPPQGHKPEDHPWKPVDEDEHQVPQGHPETGGGWLAEGRTVWPFTVGGTALLAGAGLTGFAMRRRKA
ncbi:hypothetical protein [Nonomuraea sediminis]|uniref:hypothetical protein n=1 Tax=Nonomuraea sediminis TaxID=2835864 RepID=UPI001BDC8299|nr:hypothetical protein [Nonomuraea sediminis]